MLYFFKEENSYDLQMGFIVVEETILAIGDQKEKSGERVEEGRLENI